MKRFQIKDLSDVANAMYDEVVNKEKTDALFVGFYEDALEVIKEVMQFEGVYPRSFEIHPVEWDWYDKEYYVYLDKNLDLWVREAWKRDVYLDEESDIVFIANDCNSAILKNIETNEFVEVSYADGLAEDCECDCCEDCCSECCCGELEPVDNSTVTTRVVVDNNGHIHGFEKTWTSDEGGMHYISTYQHFSNDEDYLKKLMKDFDVKFR